MPVRRLAGDAASALPPNTEAGNNGKVTLAILGQKADQNTRMLRTALQKQDQTEAEVVVLKIEQAKIKERLKFRTVAHSMAEALATGLGLAALFSK